MRSALALLLCGALLAAAPAQRAPTLWLIGDSTMAERTDTTRTLERGWGQALPPFLDGTVPVRNAAVNGRSTRSFLAEGKWDAVRVALRRGDVVLIEFGHNDEKSADSLRFTNPTTGYRRNLARFVTEARAAGATPVLLTPIARRRFNESGVLEDTHGLYGLVVRDVARDLSVPLVDLQTLTEELIERRGPEGSKTLFNHVPAGASPLYPDGRADDTHLNAAGAREVARLAARALRATRLPLFAHVVGVD